MSIKSVCVFCGANDNALEKYRIIARQVGAGLAERNIRLVYGGSLTGCMGEVANSTLAHGGRVLGVFPESALPGEQKHSGLTELVVTKNMHQRKQRMADEADAFVTMPGSLGTMDETFEITTWKRLGLHEKPILILNAFGYFDFMPTLIDQMEAAGFAHPKDRDLFSMADTVPNVLSMIDAHNGLVERPLRAAAVWARGRALE